MSKISTSKGVGNRLAVCCSSAAKLVQIETRFVVARPRRIGAPPITRIAESAR